MSETDNALIAQLRRDGRASISDLAARLGVTRATVRARLARLERAGDIQGYTVLTRADVASAEVRGLMMLEIEGRGTARVIARLHGVAQVEAVHSTNGAWDLIVAIGAQSLGEFDDVLTEIRRFEGVRNSQTHLLLATHRRRRA